VETVLILSAVSLTTSELLSFIGTLLGVFLSILFGVMFVRGSVRINLGKFFKVTTVILIFVAIQLLISGLHELSETGVIPSSKKQMAIIGPIVRNDIFFFITMLALTALMVLFESKRRSPAPAAAGVSAAEARKKQWSARKERFWTTSVYVSSFVFIMLVTAQFIYAKSSTSLSEATSVVFDGGKATVSVDGMQPAELRRYTTMLNGKPVRFLIYKKPNGKLVTVMDACEICGGVGYYNGAQGLTCKNCNAPVNGQTVGEGGGCNPIPLASSIDGSKVTISQTDLEHGAGQIKE
jgi:high-affinity iron transporter